MGDTVDESNQRGRETFQVISLDLVPALLIAPKRRRRLRISRACVEVEIRSLVVNLLGPPHSISGPAMQKNV